MNQASNGLFSHGIPLCQTRHTHTNQISRQWPVLHCEADYRVTGSGSRQNLGRMCLPGHLLVRPIDVVVISAVRPMADDDALATATIGAHLQFWKASAAADSFQDPFV